MAPLLLSIAACGDGSVNFTIVPPGGVDFVVTSSIVNGHSHDINIKGVDLFVGLGAVYASTTAAGHTHTVTLSSGTISDLNARRTSTVTTNPDSTGHRHDFVITKP
jgi:hypothetical protein